MDFVELGDVFTKRKTLRGENKRKQEETPTQTNKEQKNKEKKKRKKNKKEKKEKKQKTFTLKKESDRRTSSMNEPLF